jgi:DNA polymerase-3 subunit alpha
MLNANSIAISNHGNLSSWLDFQDHCKKNGIKPIAAVEFYAFLSDEPKEKKSYHILVIAKTETGYRNLLKLLHLSATVGFYGKPRISEKMLFEHKEGLAVGNACISGFVTKPLMRGDETSARVIAEQFKREFGHNYFFEIMPHNNPLQASVNKKLVQIAKELDINVGVTLDVHFKDNSYEDVYLINGRNRRGITKSIIENNPPEDCLVSADFHFKDCDCIIDTLTDHGIERKDILAAMDYTVQLDKEINFEFKDKFELPKFTDNSEKYLEKLLSQKLVEHFGQRGSIPQVYKERLRYEYQVVKEKNFCDYFNILHDVVQFCNSSGIRLGGRGSVGGSLMAFLLGFNPVDPIIYELPFERFLNPFRSSMPDVDLDCPSSKREEIIEYLKKKWGENRVVQVITFGEVKAKVAIKDVAKYLEIPFQEVNALTSHIPSFEKEDGALHDLPLQKALEIPEVQSYQKKNPRLFDLALKLEGSFKSYGVHAGGVVILPDDAENIIPIMHKKGDSGADIKIAAWDKKGCEKVGLVKYDFLGLNTLEILGECERLTGIKVQDIPLDNKKTWEFIQEAKYMNSIFQLSEPKTRKYLRDAKPENLYDLAAVNTGIRPGADWDTFIKGKKSGKYNGKFNLPEFKETLSKTYGAILFQDDILFLFARLSDLTLGESDLLRRALEKGDKNGAKQYEEKFLTTCKHPEQAQEIFDYICGSMGYVFNSSHCIVYSLNGYHTAFFKANYPNEFLIANIKFARSSGKMTETEAIAELIKEAKEMGISVKLPNFANAKLDPTYNSEAKAVFLGINSLRGVGIAASEVLEKAAAETNTMQEFYEYCNNAKVDTGRMKKDGSPIMRSLTNKTHFTTLVNIGFFGDSKQVMQEIIDNKSVYGSIIDPDMLNKSEVELTNQALGFDFYSPFEAYRKTLPDQYQNNERYLILKVVELKSGQKNGRKWHMLKANSEIGQITCFLDSVSSIDKHDVLLAEYTRSKGDAINIRNYKLL